MARTPDNHGSKDFENGDPADIGVFLDHVSEDAKGWLQAQREYTLLIVGERLGRMAASLVVVILLVLLSTGVLVMCGIALGLYLGEHWGNWPLGFLGVAGFYVLVGLLFYVFGQKPIKNLVTLTMINASRNEDEV
ncbi:MAG: hypothetical protein IPH05_05150 [Flavobacteriales bacterium]|jgi:hypothetical protein|nr:hypothetical protein [Flavobacteriales bacterium]MBK6551793.1 hypothetical protein [Flavobacteriales bacterium]MBK6882319.1 hypothetical protein [Flavobacteriales bacterium]MBK7101462.1 hypothetical protein [Flavobacteriales bacterium]MBK7112170.1 hypothetical protein [Flavobacteriales bacterium]